MSWVNLDDVYVNKTGDTIAGDLSVGGALTVNDGKGTNTTYNVANEITALRDSVSHSEDKQIYSYDGGQFVRLSRSGNLVIAVWRFTFNGYYTWSVQIPDGWRPKANVYGEAMLINNAGTAMHNTCAGAIAYKNGLLIFMSAAAIASDCWHQGSMSWFVE